MARIRTIKPAFWTDPAVADLTRDERLLLIGLISSADDEGRFVATISAISGYVFPYDELPPRTIRTWRDHLAASGIVEIYSVDGREYGRFPKWGKHQKVNKPYPSAIPLPAGVES